MAAAPALGTSTAYGAADAPAVAGIVDAKSFDAKGDGIADDTKALQTAITASFGNRASPVRPAAYRALFIPPGRYKISEPLRFESLFGGWIYGAGRFASRIVNTAKDGSVFVTNGCQYSRFENLHLTGNGDGVLFDLDWDNKGPALQSNTFANMYFQNGAYGVRIGETGFMGSENLFLNCAFAGNRVAGLSTRCFNALQQTIIGGNFQSCGIGVHVWKGSVPVIHGAGFQLNGWDIKVDNGAADAMSIQGCRTESDKFASIRYQSVVVSGCTQYQSSGKPGIFLECDAGTFSVDSCTTIGGKLVLGNGCGDVRSSQFGRDDWAETLANSRINVSSVVTGKIIVGPGTGTQTVLERGYVRGQRFTAA